MTNWTTNLPPTCSAAVPSAWQGQEDVAQSPQAELPWKALGFLWRDQAVRATSKLLQSLGREMLFIPL